MSIISTQQFRILGLLAERIEMSRIDLQEKTGIATGTYDLHMSDLRDRELVHTQAKGRLPSTVSITMAGQRALAAHIRYNSTVYSEERVKPAGINLMTQDKYVPSKKMYFRNDGHGQMRSRGIGA
jgi:DNA-binding MarR family transcriptional regulator